MFGEAESPADVEEMCAWVRTLGLDPTAIRPWGVIVNAGGGWKLHLLRMCRTGSGRIPVVARGPVDDVADAPVVIDLPNAAEWPDWFGQLGPVEVPDAPGATIVRALPLAKYARTVACARRHAAEVAVDRGGEVQ